MLKTDKAEEGQSNPGPLKLDLGPEKIQTVWLSWLLKF
jgi:hypothetical protein